jgi:hypothetical protein
VAFEGRIIQYRDEYNDREIGKNPTIEKIFKYFINVFIKTGHLLLPKNALLVNYLFIKPSAMLVVAALLCRQGSYLHAE